MTHTFSKLWCYTIWVFSLSLSFSIEVNIFVIFILFKMLFFDYAISSKFVRRSKVNFIINYFTLQLTWFSFIMQIFIEIPPNRICFLVLTFAQTNSEWYRLKKLKMLYIKTIIKRDHFKYVEYNLVSQQKQHLK